MLTKVLHRFVLENRKQLPPTFLLPWIARLSTTSQAINTSSTHPPTFQAASTPRAKSATTPTPTAGLSISNSRLNHHDAGVDVQTAGQLPTLSPTASSPLALSDSLREMLPLLRSQAPHYITVHIHGFGYLVTQGDTVRLPFLMPDVQPGDVIRLNRAINLGSRDYTLKPPAPPPKPKSPVSSTNRTLDPTSGSLASYSQAMPEGSSGNDAPQFIPNIAKGKYTYLDERLFVCRAIVMGVENEPMRIKEKTKRRQRHIRHVKSKHRYTILKIKELRVNGLETIEGTMS